MIDLSQWRASIGGWNSRCTSYCCPSSSPNKISAVGDCLGALAVLCGCQVMMSLLSVVLGLKLILMLSGDIELNPGPEQPPELNDVFRLLKLHSVAWNKIGRALNVPKNFRDKFFTLPLMVKDDDSKLEDVLAQWIESQCSEVSWDHLIEVLQDDLMMADTVSKIKEYLLNNDEAKEKYQWKDKSASGDDNTSTPPKVPHCIIPDILPEDLETCSAKIERILQYDSRGKKGIAFVTGVTDADGVHVDLKNVKTTFESLKFVVEFKQNLTAKELACLLEAAANHEYPLNIKFIVFYFAGHGGIDSKGNPFIVPLEIEKSEGNRLQIDHNILEPFRNRVDKLPLNGKRRQCLFLFDCCLSESNMADSQSESKFRLGNPPPDSVVAYATAVGSKATGDSEKGGLWTRHLCDNLKVENISLSQVLDNTREECAAAKSDSGQSKEQLPHYECTTGLSKVYLNGKPTSGEKKASSINDQLCPIIPSLPPCLTRYSGLLKQKYKDQPVLSSAEWPPRVGKDYYGRLLLLDKMKRDDKTEQNKIWNSMRGNIDVLPNITKSRVVDIPDVLKPDSSDIMLIDGPPGVGKTTFCRKLVNMWANEQLPTDLQQRYSVVLYCSLRDKRITGANALTDIMKVCYSDGDDDDNIKMVSKYIAEHSGDGLLIIFDGWDELSKEHRESPLSLAVRFIRREILLKCAVIVTSRSYASESIKILNRNYRHFEVIGFGEDEVLKVIEETLHEDGQLASDLIKELKSQTNIESLCYIPLVCSMVILVYKKSKQLPSRLTELYEDFVLHAVRRHVQKSLTISTDPIRIRSLNRLPSCIKPSFKKLCHFAYLSLKANNPKMTFSLPELEDALDESFAEGYIGLMTTVRVYDEELYQFPHLTIQEFLAAWWIANNDGMDVKALEEHFEDDHFRMCLRFVAGLTGLKNEKFKEMKYFKIQLDLQCAKQDACNQLISTDIPQRQLHLLYESNNTDLCKHMANTCIDNSFCFERFCGEPNSFDVICVLFFLHSSGITWNKIHLLINHWSSPLPGVIMADTSTDVIKCKTLMIECDDVIRPTNDGFIETGFLDKVLHLFSSDNVYCMCNSCYRLHETLIALLEKPQIKTIHVKSDKSSINVESFPVIKELLETTMTLEELKVEIDCSTKEDTTTLTALVIDGVMRNKSIKSLYISSYGNFDYSDVSGNFEQLLKDNTTLEAIVMYPPPYDISEINAPLRSVECSWLKPTEIESVLVKCQNLQSLTIDGVSKCSWLKLTEIESVLARCQHLRSVTINGCEFPQPVRTPITNLFNHLPKLSKLNVYLLGDSNLWVELFTILQTNQTLKELSIYEEEEVSVMNDEVLLSLKIFLIRNKSIKHLDIYYFMNSINFLTEGLSNNKTIERLSLCWIGITTSEGRSFLNTVSNIESLNLILRLDYEGMDCIDVFLMITSLLHQNTHIKELHIIVYLESSIHDESLTHFEKLIETIYHHPTLEYVYLKLNKEFGSNRVDLITLTNNKEIKTFVEQCLYKKQISSPHTRILPLITFPI